MSGEIKAIETRYAGYRFRSRIEARWAVFFDALGIRYRYEPDGYVLEGKPYLPDFYLPGEDCFIEIKGQEPTTDEIEKARLLSVYTGKNTWLCYGEIGMPDTGNGYETYSFPPPAIYTHHEGKPLGSNPTHEVEASQMVKILLQRLDDAELKLVVAHHRLEIHSAKYIHAHVIPSDIQKYITALSHQQQVLSSVVPLFIQHGRELITALTPEPGWECSFFGSEYGDGFGWGECSGCGDLGILYRVEGIPHNDCQGAKQASYVFDTPRLIAAYTAARSARFEHGEKPDISKGEA